MKAWPKTMTITVTEDDVACGNRGDAHSCPVALALDRRLGPSVYATAGELRVYAQGDVGCNARYAYPPQLKQAIAEFDQESTPIPLGTYRLTREDPQ